MVHSVSRAAARRVGSCRGRSGAAGAAGAGHLQDLALASGWPMGQVLAARYAESRSSPVRATSSSTAHIVRRQRGQGRPRGAAITGGRAGRREQERARLGGLGLGQRGGRLRGQRLRPRESSCPGRHRVRRADLASADRPRRSTGSSRARHASRTAPPARRRRGPAPASAARRGGSPGKHLHQHGLAGLVALAGSAASAAARTSAWVFGRGSSSRNASDSSVTWPPPRSPSRCDRAAAVRIGAEHSAIDVRRRPPASAAMAARSWGRRGRPAV